MMAKNNEQGSTMIETIMYICILIALGTTLAQGVVRVFNRYQTGRLAQQIIDLKKAIIHFTAADEDYTKLAEEEMIKHKAIPFDMQNMLHAMNGKIEFGPSTEVAIHDPDNTNYKYMFYITFKDIDKEACIELLTQGQFYGDGSEMDSLIINHNYGWKYPFSLFSLTGLGYITTLTEQRLDMKDAIKGCVKTKDNEITWIFS